MCVDCIYMALKKGQAKKGKLVTKPLPRAKGKTPEIDQENFSSKKSSKWFKERRNKQFIIKKCVMSNIIEECNLNILFGCVGWERILHFSENITRYYTNLVEEFYANIEDKDKSKVYRIRTKVRGT